MKLIEGKHVSLADYLTSSLDILKPGRYFSMLSSLSG